MPTQEKSVRVETGIALKDLSSSARNQDLPYAHTNLITVLKHTMGPCGFGLLTALFLLIPISMAAFGSSYLHACPANKHIPIYLVVGGVLGCLNSLFFLIDSIRLNGMITLLSIFLFVWFIIGSVWIFSMTSPNYNVGTGSAYCNKHLYRFAFWMTLSQYLLFVIMFIYLCLVCSYVDIGTIEAA